MSVPSDAAQIRSVTTQYHRPEAGGSLADGASVTHCRASGSMHGDLIKVNVRLTSRSRCSLQIVADDNDVIALKGECHKQDAPCVTRSGSPADLARTESGCHRSRHRAADRYDPELRDHDKSTDALIEWRCEVYRCAEVGNRASATVRAVRRQHQPETESIDSGLGRCDGRPRNLSESSFCAIGLPVSRERRNERARGYRHSHLR